MRLKKYHESDKSRPFFCGFADDHIVQGLAKTTKLCGQIYLIINALIKPKQSNKTSRKRINKEKTL